MEKILLINGISSYLYFLVIWLMRDNAEIQGLKVLILQNTVCQKSEMIWT